MATLPEQGRRIAIGSAGAGRSKRLGVGCRVLVAGSMPAPGRVVGAAPRSVLLSLPPPRAVPGAAPVFLPGASLWIPPHWLAWPLPSTYIGRALAALALIRGEAPEWFDVPEGHVEIGGRVLVTAKGEPQEVGSRAAFEDIAGALVAEIARSAGFAAVASGAVRAAWISRERADIGPAVRSLIQTLRARHLDESIRHALSAEIDWLIHRI